MARRARICRYCFIPHSVIPLCGKEPLWKVDCEQEYAKSPPYNQLFVWITCSCGGEVSM
jgi:hypothetical protein